MQSNCRYFPNQILRLHFAFCHLTHRQLGDNTVTKTKASGSTTLYTKHIIKAQSIQLAIKEISKALINFNQNATSQFQSFWLIITVALTVTKIFKIFEVKIYDRPNNLIFIIQVIM